MCGEGQILKFLVDTGHSLLASLPQEVCDKYNVKTK